MNMISIEIYADTTGQYTDNELDYCNCVTVDIPEEIVKAWFYQEVYDSDFDNEDDVDADKPFESWLEYVYTCDDTDGLYQFSVDNGYTPVCGKRCNGFIWY